MDGQPEELGRDRTSPLNPVIEIFGGQPPPVQPCMPGAEMQAIVESPKSSDDPSVDLNEQAMLQDVIESYQQI
jgi:hypothetical protein